MEDVQLRGGRKKCPNFGKEALIVTIFFIPNVVLTISGRKNPKIIPRWALCFDEIVYRSVLAPRNPPCIGKLLVARLHGQITLKPKSQTKEKCDTPGLNRSYIIFV